MSRFARRLAQGIKHEIQGDGEAGGTPTCLWPDNPTPATIADPDPTAVVVGLKFVSQTDTRVLGVRFYKASTNTGIHTGALWTVDGTQLASVNFTSETASGWQQQLFTVPVNITAGTIYVVSYHTTVGHYSSDSGYFSTSGHTSGILSAPADSITSNGVYAYGTASTFPDQTYGASNYWVDVIAEDQSVSDSPPVISQFTANPSAVSQGEPTTLSWFVAGSQPLSLSIDNDIGTVSGVSTTVTPSATTAYTLTASNNFGSVTATTTVSVAPVGSTPLVVDGATTYQTIDGVGTNINSLSWNDDDSRTAIDMLADDMGQTIWRVVFDMTDWETTNDNSDPFTADWTYYNSIYGGTKFQNLWGTLGYLNQKGFSDTIAVSLMGDVASWMGGASVTTSQEDEVVETIATMIYYARNTAGVTFGMIDPFNEGDWGHNEGPAMDAAQYVRLLGKLSDRLDTMGLGDIKFLGPNTADPGTGVGTWIPALMADSTLMAKIDHFGLHSYSGDTSGAWNKIRSSSYPDRNFWMTEYAYPYHAFDLLEQNASGLIVWEGFDSVYNHAILNGHGDQPGNDDVGSVPIAYNQDTKTYSRRKEFYQNKQIFKFLTPGSTRIAATGSVKAYAFHNPTEKRLTIIAYNDGSSSQLAALTLQNLPAITSFHYYKTDASNDFAAAPDIAVTGGSCQFAVPADAIVTLTTVYGS